MRINEGHATNIFCQICKNSAPIEEANKGWRFVKANFVNGEWVYDPKSPASITCHNVCKVKGEPESK